MLELWIDQAPKKELPGKWSASRKPKDEGGHRGGICVGGGEPAVSEEEYAGGSAVQVETATEKVILRRVNKATVITNTQAQVIAFGATCPKRVPGEMGC